MSQSASTAVADCSVFSAPVPAPPGSNRPGENLMDLAIGFLVPLVMAGGIHDPIHARQLAVATVTSYGFATEADVIRIMQIVGFGLGAMDNLRLAVTEASSVSLKLRLRSCASGLHRSAQQHNRTLEKDRQQRSADATPNGADPMLEHGAGWLQADQADPEAADAACQAAIDMARQRIAAARAGIGAAPVASPAPGQAAEAPPVSREIPAEARPEAPPVTQVAVPRAVPPVTPSGEPQPTVAKPTVAKLGATELGDPERGGRRLAANRPGSQNRHRPGRPDDAQEARSRLIWASAMTDVAADLQAELAGQSPAERAANQGWINSLTEAAGSLAAQPSNARPQRQGGVAGHKTDLLSSTTLAGASGGSANGSPRPPALDAGNRPMGNQPVSNG